MIMQLPNSPCESCSRGKRCTAKSDACKKFWDWFKPAWAEAVKPLRAVKLKKAGYRQCMRAHCQWANADGLCVTPCMEPEKRDYVADTVQHNRTVCKAYHAQMRAKREAERRAAGDKQGKEAVSGAVSDARGPNQ